MKKGEITVFLSLVFVLLIAFTAGILQAAVIQTEKNMSRLKSDRAVFSVFGEYHKKLLEEYHVFALEGSYGTGDYSEQNIVRRMHYYGTEGMEHDIEEIQYLTDNSGQAFREQVIAYMEQKYGIAFLKDYAGTAQEWKEQEIMAENMEEEESSIMDEYRELTQGESTDMLPDDRNPFSVLEIIGTKGLVSIALPENMKISEKQINPEEQISYRKIRTGHGSFPSKINYDGTEEKLLFGEYVINQFENAALSSEKEIRESEEDEKKKKSLDYEVEYILSGKSSDKENLEFVLFKIFLIRMAFNYVSLQKDGSRKNQAGILAVILAVLLLMPEIKEPLKQLILLAWAAGESVADLRTLLSGKKVPLVKNSDNWQLPLYGLLLIGTEAETLRESECKEGISYKDYLRAFLFLGNQKNITLRSLCRIEENLKKIHKMDFFRADQCVSKLKLRTKVSIAGNISYSFPVYFGYE